MTCSQLTTGHACALVSSRKRVPDDQARSAALGGTRTPPGRGAGIPPGGRGGTVSFLIGVLIFIVALLVSVMMHEAGHFLTAKAFGMKATQFFVGFGTTLWSTKRGETEYGVKALPVGGFVKITGMTILDDVAPADEPRSFRAKPGWQRAIVLGAGSFMHFLIAFVLLFFLAVGVGIADQSGS